MISKVLGGLGCLDPLGNFAALGSDPVPPQGVVQTPPPWREGLALRRGALGNRVGAKPYTPLLKKKSTWIFTLVFCGLGPFFLTKLV